MEDMRERNVDSVFRFKSTRSIRGVPLSSEEHDVHLIQEAPQRTWRAIK